MPQVFVNKTKIEIPDINVDNIIQSIIESTDLVAEDFFLEQNGKRLHDKVNQSLPVYVRLRILGGKGGFGSMLRAIGAQIEKTTNREACRDLSGRRLRDINEEKRLKAWLEKQGEREREAEERKKRKIEKLLAVPKHEFKDANYEEARSKLTEKVCDAVEEGFKKANCSVGSDMKRKKEMTQQQVKAKRQKTALWIDDDLSSDSSDEDNSVNSKEDKDESDSSKKAKSSESDKE